MTTTHCLATKTAAQPAPSCDWLLGAVPMMAGQHVATAGPGSEIQSAR